MPDSMPAFRRLIAISRPVLYIPSLATFTVGLLASGNIILAVGSLIGALLVTFPMGLIAYGINDISDRESDARNPRKGGADGARLTLSETRLLGRAIWVTAIISLLVCVLARYMGLAMAMFAVYVLAYTYSVEPIRLKTRPVLDSLANGVGAACIFVAGYWANVQGLTLSWPAPEILLAVVLFAAAIHALGAAMDYEIDKKVGDTTICVALGKTKTLLLCSLAFLACLPLVHGHGLVVDIYIVMAAGLTVSAIHQSAKYIRRVFFTLLLLLPVAVAVSVVLT
jgi:4-hydroxybenzoate polyprenyltransferase